MWVVLFHCIEGRHLPTLSHALPQVLVRWVFLSGHLGVPIFFVLSGFVLARIAARQIQSPGSAGTFVLQRLIRLVPPYYVAVLVGAAVLYAKARSGDAAFPGMTQFLAHLTFTQDIFGFDSFNGAFWTLAIEVQFYIAFALLLWLAHSVGRRIGLSESSAWFVGIASAVGLLWPMGLVQTTFWRGGFIALWYSFLCGALVAMSIGAKTRSREWVALASVAAIGAIGFWRDDAFAAATAATALFIFVAERWSALARAASLAPLASLGLVSYSLYLFHNPVTGTVARLVRRFMPSGLVSDVVLLACVVTASIAFATLMYVLVERPAMRWSRRYAR